MAFSLPATFANDIGTLIRGAGESVTYLPQTGPSVEMRASVQSPSDVGLIADANQQVMILFVSVQDLSSKPLDFDRFLVRGRPRTVNEAHGIVLNEATVAWQIVVIG